MKKIILILSIALLSANSATAQWWSSSEKITGNNDVQQQSRTVNKFDRIAVTGMMEVQLVAGKEGRIDLEAESNLMEYIETEVNDGQLKISVRKGVNLEPTRGNPIKLVVAFEDLEELNLTGSGLIANRDMIQAENFKITVTGSGDINLNLDVEDLEGRITGSGDINLSGSARYLDCTVTGSGDFMAYDLRTENVKASVTGSGDIEVYAENELAARVAGSGDIKYKGSPDKQNFKTSGSGSVSKS